MSRNVRSFVILAIAVAGLFGYRQTAVHAASRSILFPVLGSTSYSNDFGNPRVGHTHEGNDIFGKKMQPLLAAVDGTARFVPFPEPSYGWYISIEDAEGWQYIYIHINNDTPGTDDGRGGAMNAYAPGVARGWEVKRGQVVGYMGDSGNAETTPAHLHFEIRTPDREPINPYSSLRTAPHAAKAAAPATQAWELLSFDQFRVGTNMAIGDVAPERAGSEYVYGAAVGAPPQIRVMSADGGQVKNFFLPWTGFLGGVDVAVGDVDGDGQNEIIAGAGKGREPTVLVLDRNGVIQQQFNAYAPAFRGGVRVSTADLDGNGVAEIITGAGATGGPDVRTYTSTGQLLSSFYAYTSRFRGGVDVAGVGTDGSRPGWIVTTPGPGGGPDVRVYGQYGDLSISFYSGDSAFRGGLRVATGLDPFSGLPAIYTVPASGRRGEVRSFSLSGIELGNWLAYEPWWVGGYDVAVDGVIPFVAINTNNRRSSVTRLSWY